MCSVSKTLGLDNKKLLRKKKLPDWFKLYCPELTIYNPNSLFEQTFIQLINNFKLDYTQRIFEGVFVKEFFRQCPEIFIECVFSPGFCLFDYKSVDCKEEDRHIHIVGTHNSILYHKTSDPEYFSYIENAFLIPRTHTIENPDYIKPKARKKLIF